jgi:hypothetical protein
LLPEFPLSPESPLSPLLPESPPESPESPESAESPLGAADGESGSVGVDVLAGAGQVTDTDGPLAEGAALGGASLTLETGEVVTRLDEVVFGVA